MSGKPGQKTTPEQKAEAERLYRTTNLGYHAIAKLVGLMSGSYVHALSKRDGWRRAAGAPRSVVPGLFEERLRLKSWDRWAAPKREPERVRKEESGTYPAAGFTMIGRRVDG